MAFVVSGEWQLLGSKYRFLSVDVLYKSTTISPFSKLIEVSRNGMDVLDSQSHLFSDDFTFGVVRVIVNFMVGCNLFIASKIICNSLVLPIQMEKISSKNILNVFSLDQHYQPLEISVHPSSFTPNNPI